MQPLARKTCYALAIVLSIGIGGIALLSWKMGGIPIQTIRTDKAVAQTIMTFGNVINPHTNPKSRLVIGGITYTHLRGSPPFYLDVPGERRVLFVTHELSFPYEAKLHVFDLGHKTDIVVDITKSGFGWNIGSARAPGAPLTDYIERVLPDGLVITTRSLDWKHTFTVNLKSRAVEEGQTVYFNTSGNVTNDIHRSPDISGPHL